MKIKIILLSMCCLGLITGCINNYNKNKINNSEIDYNNNEERKENVTNLKVTINDKTYILNLDSNKTAQEFINLLPQQFTMSELNDNENAEIENKSEAFYNGLTDADIRETEITKDIVSRVMTENMLASKVYDQVLADYDFEISDEEARMITFYDMVFECYELKKDGSVSEYSPEKKALQLERANEALSSLAEEEGTSFKSIVDKYHLQYSAEYTMSKSELIEEYGDNVAKDILALSDGEVSMVIETQYGYHLFKMQKSNNEELTKENKQQIIISKQKEYFNGVYEEWVKQYDAHFNEEKDVNYVLAGQFPFENKQDE